MFVSPSKLVLMLVVISATAFSNTQNVNAQGRGFRIGNVLAAGGGQGFRIGGPKLGMHFGGGQGASFGSQNFGMRFGNGQGARFGGLNYGMQFGGQQGTQIGRLQTTPLVSPGTYYYGDVGQVYSQPIVGSATIVQPQIIYSPYPVVQPVPIIEYSGTAPQIIQPVPNVVALPQGTIIETESDSTVNPVIDSEPESNSILEVEPPSLIEDEIVDEPAIKSP